MHKILRPDLRNMSFPSSNFAKDYKRKEGRTQQCMNYGEAASVITIVIDIGHLFKKCFKGFDANTLTWLPYDEDEDNELVLPVKFRFESGCSDETTAAICSCIIKPCVLPAKFRHGRGKMATGSFFQIISQLMNSIILLLWPVNSALVNYLLGYSLGTL